MTEAPNLLPWLTIVGLGEDGPDGLSPASQVALNAAEIVMGPARHLGLLSDLSADCVEWPVPFAEGIALLLKFRGRRVVVLASGDPFWFGAGSVLARHLDRSEWVTLPGPSVFSLAASRLGWALEKVRCFGLHAAPMARLRPYLAPGFRAIVTLRDGAAVGDLATYLAGEGFGASAITVLEAVGGPNERCRTVAAADCALTDVRHPVACAIEVAGDGAVVGRASGIADSWFENDGQITKRPMRALALSALAPQVGECLWDIGAGSGSIGIEWLLSDPSTMAIGFEANQERLGRARQNASRLGVDRLILVETRAPDGLADQPKPDAVFIGGGLSHELLEALCEMLPRGTRLLAHAVTLESEAILTQWHADKGGGLLRIELADSRPLGRKRGWKSSYPVVQWSVTL